jgi:hypothetical protein
MRSYSLPLRNLLNGVTTPKVRNSTLTLHGLN